MKKLLFSLLVGIWACNSSLQDDYRLVADFDENEMIYVVYVPNYSIVELISTLSKHEKVGLFVDGKSKIKGIDATLLQHGANTTNIEYIVFPGADLWIRDSGPAILKNTAGKLKAVDFRSIVAEFEDNDKGLAEKLGLPMADGKITSAGGARESNGEGTIILAESFLQSKMPGTSKEEVAQYLSTHCGVENIIWLKKGLIEDELFLNGPVYKNIYPVGCGGHIDEFCRFVDPGTVLLAEVETADLPRHPMYQLNHERLQENYSILKNFDEHPLNIIRVPAAEFIYQKSTDPRTGKEIDVVITASYLNFVIGNNIILAAKYYEPGMPNSIKEKDEKVYAILQEQFPQHEVIQINPQHLNARGGGYHCMTYNLPAKSKKQKRSKLS